MNRDVPTLGQIVDKVAWLGGKISPNYNLNLKFGWPYTGFWMCTITFTWAPGDVPEAGDWLHYTCVLDDERWKYWEDWMLERKADLDELYKELHHV